MKKLFNHLCLSIILVFVFSESLSAQTISGYVKEGSYGNPLSGIPVYIMDKRAVITGPVITDESGFYSFRNIIPAGAPVLVSVNNRGVSFFGESRTITVNDGLNIVDFWINVAQDADGNRYGAIKIGTQTWLTENLKTTKFSDGTNIPLVTVDADWNSLTTPAYCYLYNNYEAFGEYYGALYNWYTVYGAIKCNKNICPDGWHVPSEKEFKILIDYCGGQSTAGIKLKAAGTRDGDGLGLWPTHDEYNQTPTNVSGFSAIPGSGRSVSSFFVAGNNCLMWSATQFEDPGRAEYFDLEYNSDAANIGGQGYEKGNGLSIRCIKDGCDEFSPSKEIENLINTIQIMINSGSIKPAIGKELISKLNEALVYLSKNDTRKAFNSMNAVSGKINALIHSGQISDEYGNTLQNSVNSIIKELPKSTGRSTSALGLTYPNPFRQKVTLNYIVDDNAEALIKVIIIIYDLSGRAIKTLVNEMMQHGQYSINWDGTDDSGVKVPLGTYLVSLSSGGTVEIKKILFVR